MSSYSAGYLNVTGNAYFDPSGSSTASFNAANVVVNGPWVGGQDGMIELMYSTGSARNKWVTVTRNGL